MQKTTNYLLFIGFAMCLLQVWWPEYYLTGDGPCHVYNAQILHDLWSYNKDTDFYLHFYKLLYQPNPNWLSTIIIALLLFVVNGVIAEKIFLTLYVVLFVSGFYLLLRSISNGKSNWVLVLFIFVFPHVLAKGFYNFSFSIAFFFWVVWSWLRFLEKKSVINGILFFLFIALVFFTHLLSFGFAAFTCAALVLSYGIAGSRGDKKFATGYSVKQFGILALFLAPFIILMGWFTEKEGGLQITLHHHFYRLVELVQLKYLMNVSQSENVFLLCAGITLLLVFFITLIKLKGRWEVSKYDGFLISLLFAVFIYLFFPESFLGRLILINMRVELFVAILLICCISYRLQGVKIINAGAIVIYSCFICLIVIRVHWMSKISGGVVDYLSVEKYINPYSVVLPLDFSPSGNDEHGDIIADGNFVYSHASEYMGLKKPLIILDNYEANMGYFPLRWNSGINPYDHLSKEEGIEGVPPYAMIRKYKQETGVTIDYIVMWCYNKSFLQNEHFRALYTEINEQYHIIYSSSTGRTILYALNKQP